MNRILVIAVLLPCAPAFAQKATPEVAGGLAELFAIVLAPEAPVEVADFIALEQARRESAESQAKIAETMAGIPQKLASAQVSLADIPGKLAGAQSTLAEIPEKLAKGELTHQQAVGIYLDNVGKFLGIKWDAQAHQHLIRARNNALQAARKAQDDAKFHELQATRLPRLLAGSGTWTGIRDAWTAYRFFIERDAILVADTLGTLQPEGVNWVSVRTGHAVTASPTDLGSLLHYAAVHTMLPVLGTPAWKMLATLLTALSDGQKGEADKLRAQAEVAAKSARELEQFDWARLSK